MKEYPLTSSPHAFLTHSQRPYLMQELHKEYGDVVRFGPREISVNNPDDIASIYGAMGLMGKKGTRGPF